MKIIRILSASVLAGTVLLSVSACSQPENNDTQKSASPTAAPISPIPSETATQTATPSKTPTSAAPIVTAETDTEAVISTVNGYYGFISSPDSLEKVKQASSIVKGRAEMSEEELKEIAAGLSEGFQYFDTSNSQSITNSYSQLFARATQSNRTPGVKMFVPPEAVTVPGGTATVDSVMITATTEGGQALPATSAPYYEEAQIKLIKNPAGTWVMLPEVPRHSIP